LGAPHRQHRIAMWSPPRARSTMMMRVFEALGCAAIDEPFYPYLIRNPAEVIVSMSQFRNLEPGETHGIPAAEGQVGPVTLRLCELYGEALVDPKHGFDVTGEASSARIKDQ
jgi:hypothetical protein